MKKHGKQQHPRNHAYKGQQLCHGTCCCSSSWRRRWIHMTNSGVDTGRVRRIQPILLKGEICTYMETAIALDAAAVVYLLLCCNPICSDNCCKQSCKNMSVAIMAATERPPSMQASSTMLRRQNSLSLCTRCAFTSSRQMLQVMTALELLLLLLQAAMLFLLSLLQRLILSS